MIGLSSSWSVTIRPILSISANSSPDNSEDGLQFRFRALQLYLSVNREVLGEKFLPIHRAHHAFRIARTGGASLRRYFINAG
jgi:hypothetical protein